MDTLSRGMMINELKEMTKLHENAQSLQHTNQQRIIKQQQALIKLKTELTTIRRLLVLEAAKKASAQYRAQVRYELEKLKEKIMEKKEEKKQNEEKDNNSENKLDFSQVEKKFWQNVTEIGPFKLEGRVVKGEQRGRKLNCKTANLDTSKSNIEKDVNLRDALNKCEEGVYIGWAKILGKKTIHKNVLSIGYNPHFENKNVTIESHLLHKFKNDFYDKKLKIIICGFIRPQYAFKSNGMFLSFVKISVQGSIQHIIYTT